MEKFTADANQRISKEKGKDIINNGKRLGESEWVKDSYWSGYKKDGNYYLSLSDNEENCWEVSYEIVKDYLD